MRLVHEKEHLLGRVVLHSEGEIKLQKQPMLVWNAAS